MFRINKSVRITGGLCFVLAILFLGGGFLFSDAVAGERDKSATVRLDVDSGKQREEPGFWDIFWRYIGVRRPSVRKPDPGTGMKVVSTGYAPSPYQTDSTPCITAAGTRVRRGTVASNFLPMGTLLEINNEVYIVEDRMNPRYQNSIDVFFASTSEALEFGRQELDVVIIGYGEPGQELPGRGEEEDKEKERVDESADEADQDEDPSFGEKVWAGMGKFSDAIGDLIGARSYDVNRYDVDCF